MKDTVFHSVRTLTLAGAGVLLGACALAFAAPAQQYQAHRLAPGRVLGIDPETGTVIADVSTGASAVVFPTPQTLPARALAIRDGVIVGTFHFTPPRPDSHAFVSVLGSGVLTDLGTTGGNAQFSTALAVNNGPSCAGFGERNDESALALSWPGCIAPPVILASLGGSLSAVRALSDAGDACGFSPTARFETHATCWLGGDTTPTDLQTIADAISFAEGVSPTGGAALIVVGTVTRHPTRADRQTRAFRWQAATGMVELAPVPGQTQSTASGVSDAGDVVGASFTPDPVTPSLVASVPTVWGADGVPVDVEARTASLDAGCELDTAAGMLNTGVGISLAGAIIVNGVCDGVPTGFLLTPVPGAVAQRPPESRRPTARHGRHLRLRQGHEKLAERLARFTDDGSPEARRFILDALRAD
jgi:uncharacterized membrane protein